MIIQEKIDNGIETIIETVQVIEDEKRDIFDMSDRSDLPTDLQSEVMIFPTSHMMLACFEKKDTLSLNELQIAIYRKFGTRPKRSLIRQVAYNFKKKNKLQAITPGVYKYLG